MPCLGLPYPSRRDRPSLDPMANRALSDAERLGYSLLATVSLDEFLYVHNADYSGLNFFTQRVLTGPYSLLNWPR